MEEHEREALNVVWYAIGPLVVAVALLACIFLVLLAAGMVQFA